jgi:hypothetical protein
LCNSVSNITTAIAMVQLLMFPRVQNLTQNPFPLLHPS